MAIDYSKWDKIELSDDSDIEVHPNVDKNSFIRWKQQDIHQKRIQRNNDIHTFEIQVPMYEELNKRVNQLLKENSDEKLGDFDSVKKYLNSTFDNSKPNGVEEDASTYNEMIEDLFVQLKDQLEKNSQDPNDGASLRFQIVNHVKKIDDVLTQQKDKLKVLYKERELHISSEDMHTGFDRSFLNKGETKPSETASASAPSQPSSTVVPKYSDVSATFTSISQPSSEATPAATSDATPATTIDAIPSTSQSLQSTTEDNVSKQEEEEAYELDDIHPDTLKYSKIPIANVSEFTKFLKAHPHIVNIKQKDSLLMKAFDAQLSGDTKRAQQIVFYSTLLQYIHDIVDFKKASHPSEISQIVEQFISKLFGNTTNNQLLSTFLAESEKTFKHIITRCEYLSQEAEDEGEGVEEIQLKSLDDNSKLIVNLPDPNSTDPDELQRVELFQSLPIKMQNALKTESLDEVNGVFHGMPINEAEEILEIFEAGGIIGLEAVLENEQDWKELKDEYTKVQEEEKEEEQPRFEELAIDEHPLIDSNDVVD